MSPPDAAGTLGSQALDRGEAHVEADLEGLLGKRFQVRTLLGEQVHRPPGDRVRATDGAVVYYLFLRLAEARGSGHRGRDILEVPSIRGLGMATSSIEWTEATWNPVTGCTKISPGCKHCYAERMARRLQAMGQPNYRNGFRVTLHEHMLGVPFSWKTPRLIFVNSMSDLFHEDVPLDFIQRVFKTMRQARWHQFQILTKRSERLVELDSEIEWPGNVWMGVSVESEDYSFRIDDLRATSAKIKFLSLEPLLGSLPDLDLGNIDWVIVGGESGPGSRPMEESWATDIRDQCVLAGVPFFFKQWGGLWKKRTGRLLEGRIWNQFPETVAALS